MNIDPLARSYKWLEYAAFGHALEDMRFRHLDALKDCRRILILGEGDGRALQRILAAAPQARIDVVEQSPAMIQLASRRTGYPARVRFLQQDFRQLQLEPATYDALVTFFFLDCFPPAEAAAVVSRCIPLLTPSALWLVAEFAIPNSGWRKLHAAASVRIMYWFFRLTTGLKTSVLPPVSEILHRAGLHREQSATRRAGLITSELWRLPTKSSA